MKSIHLSRRRFLEGTFALTGLLMLPPRRAAAAGGAGLSAAAQTAVASSQLVYVSPIRSDGQPSTCQAEVWFGNHADELFIVTAESGWKSRSVKRGLDSARIWVGDFGPWKKSQERYKAAPSFLSRVSIVEKGDSDTIELVLGVMGKKYPEAWGKWEPRFRDGLADGSRVMIRYRPIAG